MEPQERPAPPPVVKRSKLLLGLIGLVCAGVIGLIVMASSGAFETSTMSIIPQKSASTQEIVQLRTNLEHIVQGIGNDTSDIPDPALKTQVDRLNHVRNQLISAFSEKATPEQMSHLISQLSHSGISKRSISDASHVFYSIVNFKNINDYGCWCQLGTSGTGWGNEVDNLDTACKVFQHCRRCIDVQGTTDGTGSCNPLTKSYQIGSQFQGVNIWDECTSSNSGDTCAQQVCSCEVQFVSQLLGALFDNTVYDTTKKHSEGFSPESSCQVYVTGSKNWVCCGSYPTIMPYNSYDKQCCHSKLPYDADYQLCCTGGTVVHYSGSCSTRRRRSADSRSAQAFFDYVKNSHFYESHD